MATTYVLISSNVLGVQTNTVTFSSIPQTYTDLVIRTSTRSTAGSALSSHAVTFNGVTTATYSQTTLTGSGTAASSSRASGAISIEVPYADGDGATANTFGSIEIYVPSYTNSAKKLLSGDGAQETNATGAYRVSTAGLSQGTSAITSISIQPKGGTTDFQAGSSFYLYGIKNS